MITGIRILCSAIMLFFPVSSIGFCVTYLLCGISDMIDGTIARKTNAVSSFGSKFDTFSDLVFLAVCFVKLLPVIYIPVWIWAWIAIVALIKVMNIVLEFVRRGKIVDLHTVLNKTAGALMFLPPFTLNIIDTTYSFPVVCVTKTAAAIQETWFVRRNKPT